MRDEYASPIAPNCRHGINLEDDCVDCLKAQLAEANEAIKLCSIDFISQEQQEAIDKYQKKYNVYL